MAVNLALLREEKTREIVRELWSQSADKEPDGVLCPGCERAMIEVTCDLGKGMTLRLDLCRTCQMIWFDTKEFERWPPREATLSLEAQQAVGRMESDVQAQVANWDPTTASERRKEASFDRTLRIGKTLLASGPIGALSPWTWGRILFDEICEFVENMKA